MEFIRDIQIMKDVINSLSIEEITKWIDICNKYQTYANTEATKQQTQQTPTMGPGGMIVSPLPSQEDSYWISERKKATDLSAALRAARKKKEDAQKGEEERKNEIEDLKKYDWSMIVNYMKTYDATAVPDEVKEVWKKTLQDNRNKDTYNIDTALGRLEGLSTSDAMKQAETTNKEKGPGQSEDSGWSLNNSNATMTDPIKNPNLYKPGEATGNTKIKTMGQNILGVINAVGVVVAVCTMIIIGIRYMFAGIEERAELKTTMIPYLIGAGLLFAVTTIVNIIYQFSTSLQNI